MVHALAIRPSDSSRCTTNFNGAAATTAALLERAGMASLVERVISVAGIRQWKPRRGLYLHAAEVLGVPPDRFALVATHAWDVHGAKRAGLVNGFVARGQGFSDFIAAPDIVGQSLMEVATKAAALPSA